MPFYNRYSDARNWDENAHAFTEKRSSSPPEKKNKNDLDYFFEGQLTFVKIPELPGHICRKHDPEKNKTYIQLITETHYDPESKQMRNTKVTIGEDFSFYYPGKMLANDNFMDYFDVHGKVLNTAFRKQLEEEARRKEEKENKKAERKKESQTTETEDPTDQTNPFPPEGDTRTVDEIRESLLQKEKQLEEERKALETEWQELKKAWAEVQKIREEKLLLVAEKEKAHVELLHEILGTHERTILEQAKRRPEKYMKLTQIHLINEILQEIRDLLAGSNASRYLHLAAEPQEDDLEHHPGTTYGEMDILLTAYGWAMNAYRYNRLYEADEDEYVRAEEDNEDEEE